MEPLEQQSRAKIFENRPRKAMPWVMWYFSAFLCLLSIGFPKAIAQQGSEKSSNVEEIFASRSVIRGSAPSRLHSGGPVEQPVLPSQESFLPIDLRDTIGPDQHTDAYWIRLSPGPSGWKSFHVGILLASPPPDRISVYLGAKKITEGSLYDRSSSSVLFHSGLGFLVHPDPGSHDSIYLYFPPSTGSLAPMQIRAGSYNYIDRLDSEHFAFQVGCEVVLCVTALSSLMGFFLLRDKAYGYYVAYTLFYAAWHAILSGLAGFPNLWFPSNWSPLWLAYTLQCLLMVFVPLLSIEFCDLKTYAPKLIPFLRLGSASPILILLFNVWSHRARLTYSSAVFHAFSSVAGLFFVAVFLVLVYAVIVAWKRGSSYSSIFLLGWSPWFFGSVYGTLYPALGRGLGAWTLNAELASSTWTAIVISFALSYRTRHLRREHDHLRWLSETDPLTGLLNRRSLDNRLETLLEESKRSDFPLSLVFLDIDHFKVINDTYGHSAGDEVLRYCGQVLAKNIRRTDVLGRYGGEEFILVLPGSTSENARRVAELLRHSVATQPIKLGDQVASVTISVGFAQWLGDQETAQQLIERADQAMYRAKSAGRNRIVGADDPATLQRAKLQVLR